jgi:hypothetical protein
VFGVLPTGSLFVLSYLLFRKSRALRLASYFGILALLTVGFWPVSLFFSPILFVTMIAAVAAFEWAVAKDKI